MGGSRLESRMTASWEWNEMDRETAELLASRLPARLFDVHAHLYRVSDLGEGSSALVASGPAVAGLDTWRESVERQVGSDRVVGGLFFPFPVPGIDVPAVNEWLATEVGPREACRALMLAGPATTRAEAEATLASGPFVGFKVYHVFADREDTFEAAMDEYVPEWLWELADERGMVIMLHMVRKRALRDPLNQREIRAHCERYPGARLVLAHAARGFHAPDTVDGLAALRSLDNVWFDTSGICEAAPFRAILEHFGPRRLMWASDFPITERRGTCTTVGDGFAWIDPERVDDYPTAPAVNTYPVGLESLRALFGALDDFGANGDDLKDIFHDNATRLLGLDPVEAGSGQALYEHARERIPGGTQLLSKRPEVFAPGQWPAYFRECRGCEVWDLDGRRYYDFISGIGPVLLGFKDPDVTRAVRRRLSMGSLATLNPPEEVELADRLCEIHPWADSVRFARTGGEMAAVAVRIARATTQRSTIAICGYHGWQDWYLAANLGDHESLRGHLLPGLDPLGVPDALRGTTLPFTYNNRDELQKIVDEQGDSLAAVVMEPCRARDPEPGFLEFVRDLARKNGSLLIFDEITIGWRLCHGGAHLHFGVAPDMAVFGKTLGNGHPMAAVIGTAEAMTGAETSFISSSYWTESIGPAAALAALKKMEDANVVEHVARIGALVQDALRTKAAAHHVPVDVYGYPCVPAFTFQHEEALALKTLYVQEMLAQGFLAGPLNYISLAHHEAVVEKFAAAVDHAFGRIAECLEKGSVTAALEGPVAHAGFRRLIK